MSEWMNVAVVFAVAAVFLVPLIWSLHIATKPVTPDADGWVHVTPTIFDFVMGVSMFVSSIVLLGIGVLAIFGGALSKGIDAQILLFLLLGMGVGLGWFFLSNTLSKIKFNSEILKYAAPGKAIAVPWSGVEKMKMGTNGPKIVTVEGSFNVANTRKGFYQLIEMARINGVKIQDSPYLQPPGTFTIFGKRKK